MRSTISDSQGCANLQINIIPGVRKIVIESILNVFSIT